VSLVPDWKPTNMGGVIPAMAGLPATSQCRMRLAGTTVRGHLAGGPHNEFNCDILRINSGKDGNAAKASQDAAAGLIKQVSACLAAKGWTPAPLATRTAGRSDYEETVWSNASSKNTIVVEHEAQREDRDPTTTYRAALRVRTPNPAPPKPPG
jgi:hypothetical protein